MLKEYHDSHCVKSYRFGMKGKVDVTVDCHTNGTTNTVPLELKTGRPSYSAEHKGQVLLYNSTC